MICVSLQVTTAPGVLPSHTAPAQRVAPKPDPEMVMGAAAVPDVGFNLVICGGGTML